MLHIWGWSPPRPDLYKDSFIKGLNLQMIYEFWNILRVCQFYFCLFTLYFVYTGNHMTLKKNGIKHLLLKKLPTIYIWICLLAIYDFFFLGPKNISEIKLPLWAMLNFTWYVYMQVNIQVLSWINYIQNKLVPACILGKFLLGFTEIIQTLKWVDNSV